MATMIDPEQAAPGVSASTPSSTTSGCLSCDEERLLPSSLAAEELQLALNKEADEEELRQAVAKCKELVVECDQCSPERKWLVRHLIELRLRLQECREASDDPRHPRNKCGGVSNRTVRGHHFQLQPLLRSTSSRYCDHCTGAIWSVVQAWYRCEDCGYNCHHKCLSTVLRECVHVTATERGDYEPNICPEIGLSGQRYQCAECKTALSIDNGWSEPRRCDYNGLYFCSACHWGSLAVIPARIIHNWDFTPHPVCQASLQLLRITADRPLINVEKLNSQLFAHVHELNLVKRLRTELNGMRKYLLVCRNASADRLLWKSVDRPHLIESPDLYSLQDLMDTQSAELLAKLDMLMHIFDRHIKVDCEVCRGRGHICEVCSNDEELFPFEPSAHTCDRCHCVLHKNCASRRKQCPKCVRLRTRRERRSSVEEEDEDDAEGES